MELSGIALTEDNIMQVSMTQIKARFPNADAVERIGNKSMFKVYYPNITIYLSYTSIIGVHCHGETEDGHSPLYYNDNGWSVTTSRHINIMRRDTYSKNHRETGEYQLTSIVMAEKL